MTLDAIACEPQFIDHAAPVWLALPASVRGRFLVPERLMERAAARGIEAEPVDDMALRNSSRPPMANPGPGPMAFVVSIGDTKIGRRLGYRRFAFMEHGAGQSYVGVKAGNTASYAGGYDREDAELVLVPNDYSAEAWRKGYPDARVEVVGCPKLDTLPRREGDPTPTVALAFHWPAFVCDEARTAVGHYGGVLRSLAKRFHVIGHAHPKADWPAQMERVYRAAGIEFVRDFDEVCRRADVLAFDNSSVGFEFAATGRPVVVLNAPHYRRHVHHGGRFWDWATVGVQVNEPWELEPALERALTDPADVAAERERVLDLVYAHRTGAAGRAADALASWAGAGVEVAA